MTSETIDLEAIVDKAGISKENVPKVRAYLEKVVNDPSLNIDAYELTMICRAYNDGLNAR
jgi:hypothetical protein